jgi:hypothetical protein
MTVHSRFILAILSLLAGLIATLLWMRSFHVDISDIWTVTGMTSWWVMPILFTLQSLNVALAAWRWSLIEASMGGELPPFRRAFHAGALALGLGTVLPGPLVSIASRSISSRLDKGSLKRGALSGLVDQIADISIIILFLPSAVAAFTLKMPGIYVSLIPLTILIGRTSLNLIPSLHSLTKSGILSKLFSPRWQDFDILTIKTIYWISIIRFINITAITYFVNEAVNACPPLVIIMSIPLVTLAISLAMLPGGFGIAEWSFSAVFASMGVPHGEIVHFVLANRLLLSVIAWAIAATSIVAISFWRSKHSAV